MTALRPIPDVDLFRSTPDGYVKVDWRSAVGDALLGHDVPTHRVLDEAAVYLVDPDYEERGA